MKVVLNPTEPRRAKLHMEAAWNSIFHGKSETYKFKEYSVAVTIDPEGNCETREFDHRTGATQ